MSQGETAFKNSRWQTVPCKNYYGLIMDSSIALQLAIMASTVIAGYAVVKSNLSRIMLDFEAFVKRYEKERDLVDSRLDEAQSDRAVFKSQVATLKSINSVEALEKRNITVATLQAELKCLEKQIDHLNKIHNGKHPITGKN